MDKPMPKDITAFIVDDEGKTCELRGGVNVSFEDGRTYTISDAGDSIYRVCSDGEIDGEFTRYESRAAIEAVLANFDNRHPNP
ncbi:hypothetical protein O9X98_14700 [Agrobacterium salinitolerans]|nr:hypothetical protein [Agrobacterium salinitolerans]